MQFGHVGTERRSLRFTDCRPWDLAAVRWKRAVLDVPASFVSVSFAVPYSWRQRGPTASADEWLPPRRR